MFASWQIFGENLRNVKQHYRMLAVTAHSININITLRNSVTNVYVRQTRSVTDKEIALTAVSNSRPKWDTERIMFRAPSLSLPSSSLLLPPPHHRLFAFFSCQYLPSQSVWYSIRSALCSLQHSTNVRANEIINRIHSWDRSNVLLNIVHGVHRLLMTSRDIRLRPHINV